MSRLVTVCLVSWGLLLCTGCGERAAKTPEKPTAIASPTASATASPVALVRPTPTPTKVELAWKDFKAPDGSFSLRFPGEPKKDSRPGKNGVQTQYIVELADGTTYGVVLNEIEEKAENAPSEAKLLKDMVKNVSRFFGPTAKLVSQKPVKVGASEGIEYAVTFEDKGKTISVTSRVFFTEDGYKLYQLMAGGPVAVDADKFFDTFKLGALTAKADDGDDEDEDDDDDSDED